MALLDFDQSSNKAKYLAFDLTSSRLVLNEANSDDDVKAQLISMESTNIGTTATKLKMKFWSSSGKCLSRGPSAHDFNSGIPGDTHTLDTIVNHFGGEKPSCLTLSISDCSDDDVLLFDNFLDYGFEKPITFSWNSTADSGCIRLRRDFNNSVDYLGNGAIPVPVKVDCKPPSQSKDVCEYLTSSSPSLSPSPSLFPSISPSSQHSNIPSLSNEPSALPSTSMKPSHSPSLSSEPSTSASPSSSIEPSHFPSISAQPSNEPSITTEPSQAPSISSQPSSEPSITIEPSSIPSDSTSPSVSMNPSDTPTSSSLNPTEFSQCQEVQGTVCRNLPNQTLSEPYDTVITREECKESTKTCDEIKCTIVTTTTITECWYIQKEVKDLLEEIHDFFDNKCPSSTGGLNLFSSTYSGIGCSFDEKSASFPSQEFTYASDAVILQNDGSGDCLSSHLKLGGCTDTTEWVYLFTSGHIYYTDNNGYMNCLSRDDSDTGVEIRKCERNDNSQAWIYDVDEGVITEASDPTFCLIGIGTEAVGVGSCESKFSKWSRYEECRLNTRTTTKKIKLESIQDPGQCLSTDSSDLASLTSCQNNGNEWIYNYNGNNATLIEGNNADVCMGRRLDDGLYNKICDSSDVCKEPKDFPSGLVPCDEVFWSRQVLAGEENNIFQWSLINFRNGEKLGPDYCLQAPTGTKQKLCDDALSLSKAQTWRAYGSAGDATEISVKPSATLQIVTDPEVLFQFYLFSKEGKSSRILRSRVAGLIRDVDRLQKFIKKLVVITLEAFVLVDLIQEPIGKIEDKMHSGERTFKLYNILLIPFQYVPYVGTAIKTSRLKPITGQVSKHMKVSE